MTIKQQGGIFGRNPTFNNVDVEGTLTVNGEPISDFGTMAQQDADAVAITGGNINGTAIGSTSQAAVSGTTGYFSSTLGVATNAPDARLSVLGTGLTSTGNSNTLNAGFGLDGTGAPQPLMAMRWVGTDHAGIGGTNYVSQIVVDSANSVATEIYNTGASPLIFGTNSTERMRINGTGNLSFPSGQGIDFSATSGTGTSELFDDYEEGTWTVTVATGSVTGATTAKYIKCGNSVTVWVEGISFSDITSAADITIGGLPFTAAQSGQGSIICSYIGASSPNTVNASGTTVKLYSSFVSGAFSAVQHSAFNSTANQLYFTVTYQST